MTFTEELSCEVNNIGIRQLSSHVDLRVRQYYVALLDTARFEGLIREGARRNIW